MANHITIIINVDQQAAIRAGIAYFGETQALTIDLDNFTPEERAALAELWDGKKIYIGSTFDFGGTYPRCLPTEEGLRSMLRAGLAKRADRLVREAQERARGSVSRVRRGNGLWQHRWRSGYEMDRG